MIEAHGNVLKFEGKVENVHYGASYEGVDMFAEVGLLTRNVKIHGEMEECDGSDDNGECDDLEKDSFGGHTQTLQGFKSYKIENVQFFNMGQKSVMGKYPVHFHLALDTEREGKRSYIKNNAIHHSFR